jgi:hypothetical protein
MSQKQREVQYGIPWKSNNLSTEGGGNVSHYLYADKIYTNELPFFTKQANKISEKRKENIVRIFVYLYYSTLNSMYTVQFN